MNVKAIQLKALRAGRPKKLKAVWTVEDWDDVCLSPQVEEAILRTLTTFVGMRNTPQVRERILQAFNGAPAQEGGEKE